LFFNVNGAARDTDKNKLHNEKTPQPTKGQRYDRLMEENISNIVTPHIYFIILISMIADNLVEIRLPKTQSRKCLQKSNLWRYRAEHVFPQKTSALFKVPYNQYTNIDCLITQTK
jgi:hypothetical protein